MTEHALDEALHEEHCLRCERKFITRGDNLYCLQCAVAEDRRCAVEREEDIRRRLTGSGVLRADEGRE